MILIDTDSKPTDTILYLSAELLEKFRQVGKVSINKLDKFFDEAFSTSHPTHKNYLCLNFLFLLNKIELIGSEIIYVSK